jgi:hypothetical protein
LATTSNSVGFNGVFAFLVSHPNCHNPFIFSKHIGREIAGGFVNPVNTVNKPVFGHLRLRIGFLWLPKVSC